MKNIRNINLALVVMAMMTLGSCSVVGDIFKAGYYVGIIVVLIVLGLIFWLVSAFRK